MILERGAVTSKLTLAFMVGFLFHFLSCSYRTSEEVKEQRKERDPINTAERFLLENNLATSEEVKKIKKQVQKEIEEAQEFSLSGSEPGPEHLFTDIYHNTPSMPVRGSDPFIWGNSHLTTKT